MIEPLHELNKKCQKPNYKTKGNWMVRHILRDLALPITRLLLHTKITANQVTLIAVLTGLFSGIFLTFKSDFAFLCGVLLLQLWYLLDHVDGQIARYRETACLSGRFFDFVMHHLIHGIILFSLGVYFFRYTDNFFFVVFGFIGSIATFCFNMIYDVQAKTFMEVLSNSHSVEKKSSSAEVSQPKTADENSGKAKIIFSWVHKSFEIHVMMNILTICAILQFFISFDFRGAALVYFSFAAILLAIAKNTYMILGRKVDQDFDSLFSVK